MSHIFNSHTTAYDKSTNRLIRLRGMAIFSAVVLALFILQLLFGTDIKILLLAAVTAFCAFLILSSGGLYDSISLVGFFYFFNTIFFAILLKTALGQSLDSNLYTAFISYLAVFIVSFQVLFAQKIVNVLPLGKPLFRPNNEPHFLKFLSITCYFLGFALWALSQFYNIDPRMVQTLTENRGFGGFNTIYPIFYMAIVAGTAHILIVSDNKKSINFWIMLMLVTGVIMGLVESRKMLLALSFGYYFATSFFYRKRFTSKQIIASILLALFAFFVFGPIVHVYRNELWFLPLDKRLDYLLENTGKMFQIDFLVEFFRSVIERGNLVYHYQYFGQNLMFFDRFATIQHNDIIIDSFLNRPEMGPHIYGRGFDQILPSFLNQNKSLISLEDQITWELGLRTYGVVGFPTVPLIACAFAATKWIGLAFVPLLVFFLLYLFLKKVGSTLYENVFAIYFFVPIFLNAHQWSYPQYILRLFRLFPGEVLMFIAIIWIYKHVHFRSGDVAKKKDQPRL